MHSWIEDICDQIIGLDTSIRFAGFATDAGKIIAYKYRKKVDPLLTSNKTQLSFIDSALRMRIRKDTEKKLGKAICSITSPTRATILLESKGYPILMISFHNSNKRIDHESLVLNGIIPLSNYFTSS